MNAVILSVYAANLDIRIPEYQKKVMEKLNKNYPFKQVFYPSKNCDAIIHAQIIDQILTDDFLFKLENPEVIMFLDIDCIPLELNAADNLIKTAYGTNGENGTFCGNIQRSNHINNNKHVFIAPSCMAISIFHYKMMGKPSAIQTSRGDVCEEWTYLAEEKNIPTYFYLPNKYDAPVFRQPWEKDKSPSWKLGDNDPEYGIGTTFNSGFWHMFQSFYPGQTERFINKCEEVLNNG